MIVLGAPVQNRAWVLPYYLKHISELDYDKKSMILLWVVNDSPDKSFEILRKFQKENEAKYAQIIIKNETYGLQVDNRNKGRSSQSFHQFAYVRNRWVEAMKELPNIDYVFSVDSDILIPANSLKKLMSNDKDICSMLVNNMAVRLGVGKDCHNILKTPSFPAKKYSHILNFELNRLFEVDATGAAYLIKRKVFDNTTYQYHQQGEDIGFCINAKINGYEIWCDSGVYGNHIMNDKLLKESLNELK